MKAAVYPWRRAGDASRALFAAGIGTAMILLGACAADVNVRGNTIDQDRLEEIRPGAQSRESVRGLLGSPTNVATFSNETWYYISQKDKSVAFNKLEPLSRNVVAISFDDRGQVAEVKTYSLDDARNIQPVERETPTPGREFSLLQQLLGNLGRFEGGGPEQF